MAKKKVKKRVGKSNVGSYSSKRSFDDPEGGAPMGSYPITSKSKRMDEDGSDALKRMVMILREGSLKDRLGLKDRPRKKAAIKLKVKSGRK